MTQTPDLAVAMDWGGTWTRVAVVDRAGDIRWQNRVANTTDAGKEQMLAVAEGLLLEAVEWAGRSRVAGVGIAVAGPVDPVDGTLYQPPNLLVLDGVSLKPLWEATLGLPVKVGNDANLAALGEYHHGAGRSAREQGASVRTLVYLTVSTGIGGGVVDGGRMLLGANGLAAEIGHMTIDFTDGAPRCLCGGSGHLESLASGTAIARIARERLANEGPSGSLLAEQPAESLTSESVFQAAGQNDPLATSILDGVVRALSVGLTNVLHLYNPDLVVLGGGVSGGLRDLGLLDRIHAQILERAMSQRHTEFQLVVSELGDAVGMVGAATLVWSESGTGSR
ncbi:MAG: ROK family protein [Chloroflexi bacterium]|nr:ROK family protein [Chloroflexota bacterium]